MIEIYRHINGFSDRYEVSSIGNVKANVALVEFRYGQKRIAKERVLNQKTDKDGYKRVTLHSESKRKYVFVHRLVAAAFLGDITGFEINHKNGIKDDNRVENLEIVTGSQNQKHKYQVLGCSGSLLGKTGELHPSAESVEQIELKTGRVIKTHKSMIDAANETNTRKDCISACCRGKQSTSNGFKWRYAKQN